jgi:uncharacterized protein YvpB
MPYASSMQKSALLPLFALPLLFPSSIFAQADTLTNTFLQSPISTLSEKVGRNIEENILPIPLQVQTHNLSCEATAMKMILDFYNIPSSEDTIQSRFNKHPNPNLGFRGNVDGAVWGLSDYGVYADEVARVLTDLTLPATSYRNISQEYLKRKVISGKPAIIWVNIANPRPQTKLVTIGKDKVKLVTGEHTVVVTGFKDGKFLINDPWRRSDSDHKRVGEQSEVANLDSLMWDSFDHMAVIPN